MIDAEIRLGGLGMKNWFHNLKNVKRCLITLLGVALTALAFCWMIADDESIVMWVFTAISFLALAGFFLVDFLYWRCPHCGRNLGRLGECGEYCTHCGKELFTDKGSSL